MQKARETALNLVSLVYIKIYVSLIIILNVLSWVIAYYINSKAIGNNVISLHYNVDFGVNLIGNASAVYAMPAVGLFIFLGNFIILFWYYKKNLLISHLLLISPVLVNSALLISLQLIYFINFR